MKVYIVAKEPFPNGMAATNRIKCYAKAIKDGGLSCEILVYGCTEIRRDGIRNTEAQGFYEGIPFRYIGGTTTDTRCKPIRLFAQFRRLLQTENYLRQNLTKGDVLFMYNSNMVTHMLELMRVAISKGAYCVRDLCEFPYGTGNESNKTKFLRGITISKQFPKLDGIISISSPLLEFAKRNAPLTCKHIKIPIMVEYDNYVVPDKSFDSTVPFIFHAGTLYQQKDGILGMIEAFGLAKNRLQTPIKFVLTGSIDSSPQASEIRTLINRYHLQDSIEFVGYLFGNQVKDYLSKASLVISNRPKSRQDFYGFSTKIGEYLASGTPLITTDWGEVVNWLKDRESAYIIEPDDTDALADAIVRVFSHPDEAYQIGKAGQEVCRQCFDYRVWSSPLVDFLLGLRV